VLERLAGLIDSRHEELARICAWEIGKLISRDEVWIVAEIARFYAREAEGFLAPIKTDSGSLRRLSIDLDQWPLWGQTEPSGHE
jgi:succinate-semialdehyde dehydrogenase/glutarate-semialdehyde dehydrogenase